MIRVEFLVVGPVSTNCYLVIHEERGEALIVDPGDRADKIAALIEKEKVKPVAILLTHGHFDHMMAAEELRRKYELPVYAGAKEKEVLNDPELNLSEMFIRKAYAMDADHYLNDGEELVLAGCKIRVLETPGHTAGGSCYYLPDAGILFCGDTLFCRSIGRTDFPGGSYEEIKKSIKEKLFLLPQETICYCGHGEGTKIGCEMEKNPYVR